MIKVHESFTKMGRCIKRFFLTLIHVGFITPVVAPLILAFYFSLLSFMTSGDNGRQYLHLDRIKSVHINTAKLSAHEKVEANELKNI